MDIKHLKEKSYNLGNAYSIYFILQAPYGYLGKWGYQILYWIAAVHFFFAVFRLFGVELGSEADKDPVILNSIIAIIFVIWALNIFFFFPNMVKKGNLKLYENMINQN